MGVIIPFLLCVPAASSENLDTILSQELEDDYDTNYDKRFSDDVSNSCQLCISSYDSESCQRCWNARPQFIPFHAKRSITDRNSRIIDTVEPLRRFQRSSGCSCCYMSRFNNQHCCRACSLTAKRTGKRASSLLTTDVLVGSHDFPDKTDARTDLDCGCCLQTGQEECCAKCF